MDVSLARIGDAAIGMIERPRALDGLADRMQSMVRRRSGLVHALLNTTALGLYAGSFALRRSARRRDARVLSGLGFAVLLASAYIGGHLVYRLRVGVDRSQPTLETAEFIPVPPLADLREGALRAVEVHGHPIVLVRRGDHVAALAARCSHLGGPLPDGTLEGDTLRCPWHGSRFALDDGRVVEGPATASQPCFETRIRQGQVEIRRPPPDHPAQQPARDTGVAAG